MTDKLKGKIAVVAGASRGRGRGIAVALGKQAAIVYVTGRTIRGGPPPVDGISGVIEETAEEVTRRGGVGIPVKSITLTRGNAGVSSSASTPNMAASIFSSVRFGAAMSVSAIRYGNSLFGNCLWASGATSWAPRPQAFWIAAREAARLMSEQGSGLITAISEPMIDMDKLSGSPQWDLFEHLPHYALNRLVVSLAPEARKAGITLLGLLPGFMKTERVQVHMQDEALQKLYRYDLAESPEYTGRAVVALAADPNVIAKSGQLVFVGDVAKEYGFTDIDGRYIENFFRAVGRL